MVEDRGRGTHSRKWPWSIKIFILFFCYVSISFSLVFITDRIKDLIKYKGHQVCPTELEGVVLRHPSVADVAVVGVNDHEGQEIPKG